MGKYTQTLFEYMESIDLDPFDEQDQIRAGRTLLKVDYNVPKEVMDMLLQRFVIRYINNEIGFSSLTRFRMELMKYAVERRPWYEKMYNAFEELLPYDFTEKMNTRNLSQDEFDNIISEIKKDLKSTLNGLDILSSEKIGRDTDYETGKSENDTEYNRKEELNTDRYNRNKSDRDATNTTRDTGTSSKTDSNRGWSTDSGYDTESGVETETDRKEGTITLDSEKRNAQGFGSINDLAEPGMMVDESDVGGGKEVKTFDTLDSETTNFGKHTDKYNHNKNSGISKTTERVSHTNIKSIDDTTNFDGTISDRGDTTSKSAGTDNTTRESNKTRNTELNDEQFGTRFNEKDDESIEDITKLGEKNTDLTETTKVEGKVEWKMKLLREFYDLYVVVDEEWVRDARQLFSYIY